MQRTVTLLAVLLLSISIGCDGNSQVYTDHHRTNLGEKRGGQLPGPSIGGSASAFNQSTDPWSVTSDPFQLPSSVTPTPSAPMVGGSEPELNPFLGIDFAGLSAAQPGGGSMQSTFTDVLAAMEMAKGNSPTVEYEQTWRQATQMIEKKQFDQALTLVAKMRQLRPHDVRPQIAEGVIHLHQKELMKAVAAFELAAKQDPNSIEAFFLRAQAYVALGDLPAATDVYSGWLRNHPDSVEALMHRLNLLYQRQMFTDMMVDAETLIRLRPNLADGYLFRAVGHLLRNHMAEAQRDFDESVRRGLPPATVKMLKPRFYPVTP